MSEPERSKTRLSNGWSLKHGDLMLLIPDIEPDWPDTIISELSKEQADPESSLTINPKTEAEARAELDRLVQIIQRIVTNYPDELDIFQYLPLTKAGKFPENRDIVIALSDVYTAARYDGYVEKNMVQIRLRPYFNTTQDFIHNCRMADTRLLQLDWFDGLKKTQPVFDQNGVPAKPEFTRAKYLKDADVRPGFIYEDKAGTKYLCLSGCDILYEWLKNYESDSHYVYGVAGLYVYVRWTAKLEKAMAGKNTLNDLLHVMADMHKCEITEQMSYRETPRKFVRELDQVFDPALTKEELFKYATKDSDYVNLCYYIGHTLKPVTGVRSRPEKLPD